MHWRGIEPRSPAWQARILPLNHQCGACNAMNADIDVTSIAGGLMFEFSQDIKRLHSIEANFCLLSFFIRFNSKNIQVQKR